MKKLVLGYCPQGNGSSVAPFDRVYRSHVNIAETVKGVDAVIFWGGTDIHPSLYGQSAHVRSQAHGAYPSQRDLFEWNAMKYCKVNNIPMIGVCRGAQLMCAFAGGKLIQHVEGHVGGTGGHLISSKDREKGPSTFRTTSCHHQMMYPFDIAHDMLAWSTAHESDRYEDDKGAVDMTGKVEPEIVFFPEIRGLAIQGHPEWSVQSSFADYCNELVEELFINVTEEV